MHRVKRLTSRIIGKRSVPEASTNLTFTGQEVLPICRLPTELLLHVLAFADRGSLFELLQTSRVLRILALPLYFRSLELVDLISSEHPRTLRDGYSRHIYRPTLIKRLRILVLLCDPVRASSVTSFRAKMNGQLLCSRHPGYSTDPAHENCTCFKLDEMVGDALKQMINLENLHLSCKLCATWKLSRHRYMRHLTTKRLRILFFECNCIHSASVALDIAPSEHSIQDLTTLHWVSKPPSALQGQWVDSRDIPLGLIAAPHLRSLYLTGTIEGSTLLDRCGIARLHVDNNHKSVPALIKAITHSSIILIYISMPSLQNVVDLINIKPSAFIRLQHLGMVSSPHPQDRWMEPLKPFESLRHLESLTLELAREDDSHRIYNFCHELQLRLPKLRKVFCQNFPSHVWIVKENTWGRIMIPESHLDWERRADDVLGWNILKGVYDHL